MRLSSDAQTPGRGYIDTGVSRKLVKPKFEISH